MGRKERVKTRERLRLEGYLEKDKGVENKARNKRDEREK